MVKSIVLGLCLVASIAQADTGKKELKCLADNIYHEARGESFTGQVAVGLVTLQRVRSKHYPNSVCDVVYQPFAFSWTIDMPGDIDRQTMKGCVFAAKVALSGHDLVPTSMLPDHYHNLTVQPYWAATKTLIVQIGNHKFYK